MARWQKKTAVVTGASGGIGYITALRLAREGMNVIACARSEDKLAKLTADAAGASGELEAVACDLKREDDIQKLFATTGERFGGCDVLVNNAGLGHHAPLMSGSSDHWREMLDLNVLALCICTREAIAQMRERGDDGHVIHISSMAAHRVPGGSGVYAATKYAVRALTEGLRQELRHAKSQIRVSAISPGYVETGFAAHYHRSEEAAEKTYGKFPCLQSEDVAEAVVYTLSQPPHVQIHDVLMRPTDQER